MPSEPNKLNYRARGLQESLNPGVSKTMPKRISICPTFGEEICEKMILGALTNTLEHDVVKIRKKCWKGVPSGLTNPYKIMKSCLWYPPGIPLASRSSPGWPWELKRYQQISTHWWFVIVFSRLLYNFLVFVVPICSTCLSFCLLLRGLWGVFVQFLLVPPPRPREWKLIYSALSGPLK